MKCCKYCGYEITEDTKVYFDGLHGCIGCDEASCRGANAELYDNDVRFWNYAEDEWPEMFRQEEETADWYNYGEIEDYRSWYRQEYATLPKGLK